MRQAGNTGTGIKTYEDIVPGSTRQAKWGSNRPSLRRTGTMSSGVGVIDVVKDGADVVEVLKHEITLFALSRE